MKVNRANGLLWSIGLHLILGFILYFGVPAISRPLPENHTIVFDVVNVSDITNIKNKARHKKLETEPLKQEKPKPAEKIIEKEKPTPAEQSSKIEPIKESPVVFPDKTKKEEPKKQDSKEKHTDQPEKKNKDDKKSKSKKTDLFSDPDFLKTLEKSAKKHRTNDDLQDVLLDLESDSDTPYNADLPMSLSEKDSIISQIAKAWNMASFNGSNSKGMQVIVKITLDAQGNVIHAQPVLDNNPSPNYPPFVESAVRAVRIASPLKNLPPEKFATWSSIEVRFDSSGMIY